MRGDRLSPDPLLELGTCRRRACATTHIRKASAIARLEPPYQSSHRKYRSSEVGGKAKIERRKLTHAYIRQVVDMGDKAALCKLIWKFIWRHFAVASTFERCMINCPSSVIYTRQTGRRWPCRCPRAAIAALTISWTGEDALLKARLCKRKQFIWKNAAADVLGHQRICRVSHHRIRLVPFTLNRSRKTEQ